MKTILLALAFFSIVSCTSQGRKRNLASVDRPPQFVLLAFDGSKSLPMWEETTSFARENNIKFTYFISGVYFLAPGDKNLYHEPRHGRGRSAIGWGKGESDISNRVRAVKAAIEEGHEIASHANGHYDGSGYSRSQWSSEMRQFEDIMLAVPDRYNVLRVRGEQMWPDYFQGRMIGFRAPLLGHNTNMFRVLENQGYLYDTSKVDQMGYWPEKIKGVWNFPLAGLRKARTNRRTLSMDYNFYYGDSEGKRGDASNFGFYEDQMYETYIQYFTHNYFGNRAPVDIGHHFSKWNGGAYWRAMKRFAKTVCPLPEVRCVTYSDLVDFVESAGPSRIASYAEAKFTPMSQRGIDLPVIPQRAGVNSGELTERELEDLRRNLPVIKHDEEEEEPQGIEI